MIPRTRKSLLVLLFSLIILPSFSQNVKVIGDSIFSLTLKERNEHNIKSELFMSKTLCEVAEIQAKHILRTGIPTHANPNPKLKSVDDRTAKFGYKSDANENITYLGFNNESDDSLSKRAINNFMNSLGHRITLLSGDEIKNSGYKTAYGQCVLFDSKRKKIIVVQVFVTCIWDSDLLIE